MVEVKATNGDTHLGGDNIDQVVIEWIIERVQEGAGHRPHQRQDGFAAAQRGGRESQDGPLDPARDRHQSAVHHRGCERPEAPAVEAHAGAAGRDDEAAAGADDGAVQEGAVGRRHVAERHQRGGDGRRLDAHPEGAATGARPVRQRAPQGREPGRGGGGRRRGSGRRAGRRSERRPVARRHAAVARHRDAGRRFHQADRAQHDHPDAQERGLLDGGRQPDFGRDQGLPGRAVHGG